MHTSKANPATAALELEVICATNGSCGVYIK